MDYEKAYKETIDKLRKLHNDWGSTQNHAAKEIESVFPELCESEDERIRKAISYAIANSTHEDGTLINGVTEHEAIAWLEKQGEQKPADKIEPKFKVGDIISNGISEVEIVSIDENEYNITNSEIENDANICNWVIYFKDQENWKLVNKSYCEENKRYPQSKQEWSEEDEKIMRRIDNLLYCTIHGSEYEKLHNWLKSLKPNHWKPSKEQIKSLRIALQTMPYSKDKENVLVILEQLIKL